MASMKMGVFLVAVIAVLLSYASADTPANCTHGDLLGTWVITESQRGATAKENCTEKFGSVIRKFKIRLSEPSIAEDEDGHRGFWTAVYNQGFEVIINHRKYFAFSFYKKKGTKVVSYCGYTFPGWSHDVLGKNWACYKAQKVGKSHPKVRRQTRQRTNSLFKVQGDKVTLNFEKCLRSTRHRTWTSTIYPEFANESIHNLILRAGGPLSKVVSPPRPALITEQHLKLDESLPEEFDWRNSSGINYLSPIRNQGACGSCYSFASMAMLEARLRIATSNKDKTVFSPQDVVGCSEYSQGCEGGFPYLIAGRYGQDFGVVPEQCFPYQGHDSQCAEKKCIRYYTADYNYVGGYFGACNAVLMKAALVKNGPIAIGFEVTADFMAYKGGIFKDTGKRMHTGFEETNHAVLVVGYGVDKATGLKYWSVKNSWGESWGENGFFRIRRGQDDLHIESMAVEANPIPY